MKPTGLAYGVFAGWMIFSPFALGQCQNGQNRGGGTVSGMTGTSSFQKFNRQTSVNPITSQGQNNYPLTQLRQMQTQTLLQQQQVYQQLFRQQMIQQQQQQQLYTQQMQYLLTLQPDTMLQEALNNPNPYFRTLAAQELLRRNQLFQGQNPLATFQNSSNQ